MNVESGARHAIGRAHRRLHARWHRHRAGYGRARRRIALEVDAMGDALFALYRLPPPRYVDA